ncbi:MAG: rhodanese-like domain-containing protein [Nocardioides sp.]
MSYTADLSPTETWELLRAEPRAVLIDVRTAAEWSFVGVPDTSELGREVGFLEWISFPGGARNADFAAQLEAGGWSKDQPLLFICRSGQRSQGAATTAIALGWERAYNVAEGFEGDLDADGHRGRGGWKTAGLPWRQS